MPTAFSKSIRLMATCALIAPITAGCEKQSAPQASNVKEAATPAITNVADAKVLKFKVTGMHCQGCADGIKDTLEEMPGVLEASASFADGSATVKTSDPTIAPKIIEEITAMEFTAELDEQG